MDVNEEPDWEVRDGEYSLVTLEPEADNPFFSKIRKNSTGEECELPDEFKMYDSDLVETWEI
eukprot:4384151-Lingulodinium_polyedra.AAC.1